MTYPHHVLYHEKWTKDRLPFDDIDLAAILLQQQQKLQFQHQNFLKNGVLQDGEDEDDLNLPMGQTQFGASRSHRRLMEENVWKDPDMKIFLSHEDGAQDEFENVRDHTILRAIDHAIYKSGETDSSSGGVDEDDVVLLFEELEEDRRDDLFQDESGDTMMHNNDPSVTPLTTRTKRKEFFQTPMGRNLR